MSAVYIENWLALGTCIYTSALIKLRNDGLSIRQIASVYGVSGTFVRNRLLAAGLNLERKKR